MKRLARRCGGTTRAELRISGSAFLHVRVVVGLSVCVRVQACVCGAFTLNCLLFRRVCYFKTHRCAILFPFPSRSGFLFTALTAGNEGAFVWELFSILYSSCWVQPLG